MKTKTKMKLEIKIKIKAKMEKMKKKEKKKLKYYREVRGWFEPRDGGGDASRSTVEKLLAA